MKLLILTQYFPPEIGAPQARLFETAKALQKRGWTVEIVTSFPNYPTGKIFESHKGKVFSREYEHGLEIRRYWLYASNSRKILPRIFSMLTFSIMVLGDVFNIRRNRPFYLMVESPPLLLGVSGWLLAWMSGSRLIMNISDLWPLSAVELGALRKDSLAFKALVKLEQFIYRKAFACTGQSEEIIQHLEKSGARQTWLFRNGVNPNRFHPPEKNAFHKPIRIVYAGLLGVAQGILELCENLRLDPVEVEFHIYGDGPDRRGIESLLATKHSVGIKLHEKVAREEMPKTLVKYDLALIPLVKPIYGAVPSKIYEAMAAGLPIVFCGGGEGARIIDRYDLGWVCAPSDFAAIQNTINEIITCDELVLQRKRLNCLKAAKQVFNRELQINTLDQRLRHYLSD